MNCEDSENSQNIKENNNQVKLEDIENAFNNTLSDFKLITKDF